MKTKELSYFLDTLLEIHKIEDASLNGLQIDNKGEVNKVALAVDASLDAVREAKNIGSDFLLVHHGLFWGKPVALVGPMYKKIQLLIDSNIALYAAHLPLDIHPELGNNAQIEKVLGWSVSEDFGEYHGVLIGKEVRFKKPILLPNLVNHLQNSLGSKPQVWDFGPEKVKRLGYVSGDGLSMLYQAIECGMDTFITGEPGHAHYWEAKEAGINVIFAGHYATETLGIKAVGKVIQEKFGLETIFLNLPTGL